MKILNDNIKLGIFDTLHDFWKERKISKNDQEDQDDTPINKSNQDFLRNNLVKFLTSYLQVEKSTIEPTKSVSEILKKMSLNNVTSATSNYERTVLKYYENVSTLSSSLYVKTTETLRYGDIIESYKLAKNKPDKNILLQKYIRSNGSH
jgi:hypothetical protein